VAAAHALPAEVRLYDHLFARESPGADGDFLADLDPASLEVLKGSMVEPALAEAVPGEPLQFERQGYFCMDPDGTRERPVFNRTVPLRDSWARISKAGGA
jgi:glutaminyl-tRNA synthetase